jgi:hypothetical protein
MEAALFNILSYEIQRLFEGNSHSSMVFKQENMVLYSMSYSVQFR